MPAGTAASLLLAMGDRPLRVVGKHVRNWPIADLGTLFLILSLNSPARLLASAVSGDGAPHYKPSYRPFSSLPHGRTDLGCVLAYSPRFHRI